jgi:hypothetical protein
MFEQYNKTSKRTVREEINTDDMSFKALKEFVGQVVKVDGFFFTEGKYGKQVVIVGNGAKINIPKRYTPDFEKIRDNDEELAYVLKGGLELVDIHEGDSSNGKTVYFTMRDALASN